MAKKEKEAKQKNSYFKDMKTELKKVVWPTPKELFNNTVAVIAFVLIMAVIVFVLDFCFDNLNKYGITTFQEAVQSALGTSSEEETSDENENEESTTSDETESEDVETEVNTTESEASDTEETVTEETETEETENSETEEAQAEN